MKNTLSTDKIVDSAVRMVESKHKTFPAVHLDIGAGSGNLISALRQRHQIKSVACDYTAELMSLKDVKVHVANLNTEKLPFPSDSFDIVTLTEVVEHLEGSMPF